MIKPHSKEYWSSRYSREKTSLPLAKLLLATAGICAATGLAVGTCVKACGKKDGTAEASEVHRAGKVFQSQGLRDKFRHPLPPTVWDADPEYNRMVPGGEFSDEEYARRSSRMKDGSEFFKDIGSLWFYKVQEGDDFETIKARLLRYQNFAYLKTADDYKLKSFNIPKKSLKPGMWIPIPQPEENRILSDEQFINYCNQAIDQILADPNYGRQVQTIIAKSGRAELLAVMTAVAKQESGGLPIGQFEFHRYEPAHSAFSFSLFHVLMKDVGLRARRRLNLTEGQLYHPRNAAKLFLAFLCDKTAAIAAANGNGGNGGNGSSSGNSSIGDGGGIGGNHGTRAEGPEKYFPIMEHLEDFAAFYNGRNWRNNNPDYPDNIARYRTQAMELIGGPR